MKLLGLLSIGLNCVVGYQGTYPNGTFEFRDIVSYSGHKTCVVISGGDSDDDAEFSFGDQTQGPCVSLRVGVDADTDDYTNFPKLEFQKNLGIPVAQITLVRSCRRRLANRATLLAERMARVTEALFAYPKPRSVKRNVTSAQMH